MSTQKRHEYGVKKCRFLLLVGVNKPREGNSDYGIRSFYFNLVVDPALVHVMLDILS